MKEIGKMIKSKGKEYSIGIREINMKANGKIINRKEMAFSNIKMNRSMVIDMKADGEMGKKKEKEFIILIMEIEEWEIFVMGNLLENMSLLLKMARLKPNILV